MEYGRRHVRHVKLADGRILRIKNGQVANNDRLRERLRGYLPSVVRSKSAIRVCLYLLEEWSDVTCRTAFPSVERIAKELEVSTDTVMRATKLLVEARVIILERMPLFHNGSEERFQRASTNRYHFVLPAEWFKQYEFRATSSDELLGVDHQPIGCFAGIAVPRSSSPEPPEEGPALLVVMPPEASEAAALDVSRADNGEPQPANGP